MAATALESLTFSQSVAYRWRSSCSRGQPVCTYRCVFVCVFSLLIKRTQICRVSQSGAARATLDRLLARFEQFRLLFVLVFASSRAHFVFLELRALYGQRLRAHSKFASEQENRHILCSFVVCFFFCFRFRFADTCRRQRSRASSTEYVVSCRAASLLTVLSLVADETKNEFTSTSFQLVTEYNSSKLNPIGDDLDIVGIEAHKPSAEHRRLREYYEPNETLPTRGVWSAKASDPFF